MKVSPVDRTLPACKLGLFVLFALLFLLEVWATWGWRMEHDPPLSHYVAFLMDRYHLFPYRDVFETCMPGTYAFHYAICKMFGYGDRAFRCVDLTLLGVLLIAAYVFVRRFGRMVAMWAAILFGLLYLSMGPLMSLQRDYVGVIPIAFALLCVPVTTTKPVGLSRFILIGLLFGMSVLIKPHLGIAFPIVFGALVAFRWHSQRKSTFDLLKCSVVSGISLLVPVSIALVWLAANSALAPFINIMYNYLPLYNAITGSLETVSGPDRAVYLIEQTFRFGGYGSLLAAAVFGYHNVVTRAGKDKATLISLTALCLCTLAYAVYPALAGKFWDYHYMPLAYFCSMSAALCLFTCPQPLASRGIGGSRGILLLLVFVIAVAAQLPLSECVYSLVADVQSGPEVNVPKQGRVDEIAGWLKRRLHEGDTVQPLDWTGGSVHGMLLARARLATQFMYDCPFYHHVSSPYVQGLRRSFISQLRNGAPRFVIEVTGDKPWVRGLDTTYDFPELRQFLDAYYAVVFRGDGYLIYERTGAVRA